MSGAAIVAFGAISAQGADGEAFHAGAVGELARESIAVDEALRAAGLARPFAARARLPAEITENRATFLLTRALSDCFAVLDGTRPGWRAGRVGLALGTSSGGMEAAELLFRGATPRGGSALDAMYFGPVAAALGATKMSFAPATLILGACASSTIAVGLGTRWLAQGECDLVLAGGFDAVTLFVAAGFEALRATTTTRPPRPFRSDRDGMCLGEGAAVVALARPGPPADEPRTSRIYGYVTGFAASADAVHVTAPDRTGAGLAAAIGRALSDAEIDADAVDLVSAHATATPFNDAAEWRALVTTFAARTGAVPVHPFKAQIGHTLGAAGALEALACLDALARGVVPASAGGGALDPDAPARLARRTERGAPRVALKLSSAFGGVNAALVLRATDPRGNTSAASTFSAYASPAFAVGSAPDAATLAVESGASLASLARSDALVRMALAAVARLAKVYGPLAGAGIVVGQAFATIETNAAYFARILSRGARAAEPRRFPYTSPNAVAGECGVAFGLTGPGFAVGGGLHAAVEALAIAAQLVQSGDAERMVVVAVDDVGPVVTSLLAAPPFLDVKIASGAVALLVSRASKGAAARVGRITLELGAPVRRAPCTGHRALFPLVRGGADRPLPPSLESACPSGGFASVALLPV